MKVLQKNLLASVAGGETEEVSLSISGDGGFGGGAWGADDWGGAGGYGNSGLGGGILTLGPFGSSGGGFDSNGVGSSSCVSAASSPASGLFNFSMTETLTLAGGLSSGVGASIIAEAAGGWGSVGAMGTAGLGMYGAAGAGLVSAGLLGTSIGTALYHNSETVQDLSQKAWGDFFQVIEDVSQGTAELLHIDRKPHAVYHP